jgi:hypothetical protein
MDAIEPDFECTWQNDVRVLIALTLFSTSIIIAGLPDAVVTFGLSIQ